jgi:hypothetical protein
MIDDTVEELGSERWLMHCWACSDGRQLTDERSSCTCGRSAGRTVPSGGVVIVGPARALRRSTDAEPWRAVPEGPAVIRPSIVA